MMTLLQSLFPNT